MLRLQMNRPAFQNAVASLCVALGPGIYGAITLLGAGGGPANATEMQNIVNSVLYAVFFFTGLFMGSVVTVIGPRYTLLFGTLGYPVFLGGLWYFTDYGKLGYPIFGGAFLGLTAAFLWTGASYIAFTYPKPDRKGTYIAAQWGTLAAGTSIASFVSFGINYHASVAQVPDAVYIVFICLMALAIPIAFFLVVDPTKVERADGTKPAAAVVQRKPFLSELKDQVQLLKDWRILVMIIPFFGSEIAIIVISTINGLYFNIRTRSLNSLMFNIMQALAAVLISFTLDSRRLGSRKSRGIISIAVTAVIVIAGWGGLTGWLYKHPLGAEPPLWDWTDSEFGGFFVLNLIFGMNMVIYQVVAQWIASSMSDDPEELARFAGFAKGCLAGGLAASFGVEAAGLAQLDVLAFNFTLQAVGLVCMIVVCVLCVKPAPVLNAVGLPQTPPSLSDKVSESDKTAHAECHSVDDKAGDLKC